MQNFTLSKQFFRDVWYLTKSYWQSDEKKKAFSSIVEKIIYHKHENSIELFLLDG